MAQQSYKKFVASAATATLVASALVPVASAATVTTSAFTDVPASYKEAVEFVVTNNIASGLTATQFGISQQIKRGDVAIMIAAAAGLNDEKAPAAGFSDVPKRGALAINSLKAAGVISGKTTTKFGFEDNVTRGEAALMLQKAFDLKAGDTKNSFSDVSDRYDAAVDALVANKVTSGINDKQFGTTNPIKRGDFAKFLFALKDQIVVEEAVVESVKATSTTTLELTGKGLNNLKVENLTLAGNTATEVVASKDGKTATVKFASAFIIDQEYSLVVKVEEVESTFKFKFTYDVTKAEVVAGTFDDDTKGQKVALKINGAEADFNALKVAGYTVNFVAVDKNNSDVSSTFFKDATTGLLSDNPLTVGDYTVQVSVSKGSNVIVSEKQTIKVRNLELAATAIKDHVLTNGSTAVGEQKSSTLVVGETATVDEITVTANSADYDVTDTTKFKVESSNPAVISVSAPTGGTLTANTPGTSKITLTYGDVKKDFTVTVANTARKVTKLTPASPSVTIVGTASKTADATVSVVDQYGDLVNGAAFNVETPSFVTPTATTATSGTNGKATITLTSSAAGNGVVLLKSNGVTLGSFGVRVTQHDNVTSKRLELVKKPNDATYSADNALDLDADVNVEYALNQYNSEGLPNGKVDLATNGYKVSYNADVVTIGSATTGLQNKVAIGTSDLTVTAKAVGSTTVAVYDSANLLVGQFTVTVSDSGYSINSVNFKSVPTIDYKGKAITVSDVLDVVNSANDDIVKGITLNKASAHQVRIDETTAELYIDANGDGDLTPGEVVLGTVTGEVVSGGVGNFATPGSFDVFTGKSTVASGDKGTVVFKVITGASTIKASTSVNVDVK
ncbi:S-layer homology domain-containing protein [Sporosarcina aquimarina]|uniref:S-layer homology domain-containing protein n=1 Tax=Sporosarcina aquimarina TaxID=114975 RepID=UPI00203D1D74|nr:S-layer homology domain-containing protein [Sporosarcina aquimarina]MCM3756136.1 S-layer homology domain-containing protein [Sporosarcina aquimarina]